MLCFKSPLLLLQLIASRPPALFKAHRLRLRAFCIRSQCYVPFATVNTRAIAWGKSTNAVCVAASVTMLSCHAHVPDAIINTATMIVSIMRIGYSSNFKVNLSDSSVDAADCAVKVTVHCRRVRAQDVLHATTAQTVLPLL